MIATEIEAAAWQLANAYNNGLLLDSLSAGYCPATLYEGYAIQDRLVDILGLPPAGWKLGLTDLAAQAAKGVDQPVRARLFSTRLAASPARLPTPAGRLMLEPEFVFRMSSSPASWSRHLVQNDLIHAIGGVYIGIELCASRLSSSAKPSVPLNLADNSYHGALVIGPEISDWRSRDLAATKVTLYCDGIVTAEGSGAAVLGHPLNALLWLANELAHLKNPLAAGDWVTTGSCTGAQTVSGGVTAKAVFENMGEVHVVLDDTVVWPEPYPTTPEQKERG